MERSSRTVASNANKVVQRMQKIMNEQEKRIQELEDLYAKIPKEKFHLDDKNFLLSVDGPKVINNFVIFMYNFVCLSL